MGEILPFTDESVELDDYNYNRSLDKKAKNIISIRNQLLKIRDYISDVDIGLLLIIPGEDSSTLRLYNALIESLELDAKRITEKAQ